MPNRRHTDTLFYLLFDCGGGKVIDRGNCKLPYVGDVGGGHLELIQVNATDVCGGLGQCRQQLRAQGRQVYLGWLGFGVGREVCD